MLEQLAIPINEQLQLVEDVLRLESSPLLHTANQITRYITDNGGKRIRPIVCLLSCRVAGARDEGVAKIAATIEILHTASLMHDDVVDNAPIRRGSPSAKAKWGNQMSVLIGDLMFCRAYNMIVEYGNTALLNMITHSLFRTVEGELLEIEHQNDVAMPVETYMKVIDGKTAALFSAASHAAAIMAGMESELLSALKLYGYNLGMAFQLTDDALDYISDEDKLGKNTGSDFKEGKLTYPLIATLSKASASERTAILNAMVADCFTREKFTEIRGIIGKYDGIEATFDIARKFAQDAKNCLNSFKPSLELSNLSQLADYVCTRRS